jgi:hypothetical protein
MTSHKGQTMTQAAKHTPTPWHAISQGMSHFIAQKSDSEFRFAIAKVFEGTYHPDGLAAARAEAKANAAHIVRCVNAHDELVAALVELDANLENHQESEYARYQRRTIRAALAKVQS